MSPRYPSPAPPRTNLRGDASEGQKPSTLLRLSSSAPLHHASRINFKQKHLSARTSSAPSKFRFCERHPPMRVSRRRSTTEPPTPHSEPRPAGAGCPLSGNDPLRWILEIKPGQFPCYPVKDRFNPRPLSLHPPLSNAARVTDSPLIPGSFSWRFTAARTLE